MATTAYKKATESLRDVLFSEEGCKSFTSAGIIKTVRNDMKQQRVPTVNGQLADQKNAPPATTSLSPSSPDSQSAPRALSTAIPPPSAKAGRVVKISKAKRKRRHNARERNQKLSNSCPLCSGRAQLSRVERRDFVSAEEVLGSGYEGVYHRVCANNLASKKEAFRTKHQSEIQSFLDTMPVDMSFEEVVEQSEDTEDPDD